MTTEPSPSDHRKEAFLQAAAQPDKGFWAEYWEFLCHNKKWWLTPILIVLLLASLLIFVSGTIGPLIYPGL